MELHEKTALQGMCVVAAALIRDFDQPTTAIDILENAGYSLKDISAADVDSYDLEPIKNAWTKTQGAVR